MEIIYLFSLNNHNLCNGWAELDIIKKLIFENK